jgi:prepilin signal peptidase PulO-like enzyme (type II secretory pathway)
MLFTAQASTAAVVWTILAYAASLVAGFGAGIVVNIAADQVEDDESPPGSSKRCSRCGGPLPAARLVPLVGFRKSSLTCPKCGQAASLRAPALTIVLGLTFPLLLSHVAGASAFLHLPAFCVFLIEASAATLLAFIFAVDLEHKLILDIAVYPAIAALLLIAVVFDHRAFAAMLPGVIIYGGLFLFFYGLGYLLYHTEALGLGDVKLAILIGLLVGWPGIVQALVLGGLFGAAISLLLLGMGTATRRTYIPYGIFMATGALLGLLLTTPYW